ncbi:unnamed protein product [Phyllotreta striolata]|uniref:Ankyrin repeat domain-containing protein 54 n=1 Tax=Phyllotreta striolata TaxID=444603 RepID=A0A9N9TMY6_PHYSR|nr:unnamed protein product [Phyllotreta striolata]
MSYSDSELEDEGKTKSKKCIDTFYRPKRAIRRTILRTNKLDIKTANRKNQLNRQYLEIRLVGAVNLNNVDLARTLLKSGVSPDTIDSECRSVLHIAVSRGYSDLVELLLKHGANPNKRDIIQNTPLHLAACVHNLKIVTMLINAKADVSCLDMHGRNPFQLASSKLQRLQHFWKEGAIEMIKLKEELKEVVDLLLSMLMRDLEQKMAHSTIAHSDVNDLQVMKLSINSNPPEELDNQISKLLSGIEKFSIA